MFSVSPLLLLNADDWYLYLSRFYPYIPHCKKSKMWLTGSSKMLSIICLQLNNMKSAIANHSKRTDTTRILTLLCSRSFENGVLNDELLHVCNQTLNGKKPLIWSKRIIITFPKKGDLGIPKNYGGIIHV